ncbi:unnamed protein product [Schistosoma curassoni]|uniref:60S ribosomal protein L23a n=1 Tax=Schistosoma curassoni TaxID=6186 RepID=A0A183KVA8_9TREM|nr:unnamed protein product [Schistosoma curassoni]
MAVRQINSVKAAGPDNITVEAHKADVIVTAKTFQMKNKHQKTAKKILIKITKKGDVSRMMYYVDAQFRDQQAKFRKARSCTNHIATLRIIMELSTERDS